MASRKKPKWMQIGEDHRRKRGWEISDVLSLHIPNMGPPAKSEAENPGANASFTLSATQLRRLRTAQRQLERARAAVESILGADFCTSTGERVLDGFEIADHQLDVAIEETGGEQTRAFGGLARHT